MTRRPKSPLSSRELSRRYDKNFKADEAYRATLPDMQNKDASQIQGANVPIQHVGISGFRLPMLVVTRDGKPVPLECTITGTVSLAADRKGINMSRIMRTSYLMKFQFVIKKTSIAVAPESWSNCVILFYKNHFVQVSKAGNTIAP